MTGSVLPGRGAPRTDWSNTLSARCSNSVISKMQNSCFDDIIGIERMRLVFICDAGKTLRMFVDYLSFGRPSEFVVQSMMLSTLFLIAGRVWTVPQSLVALGSTQGTVGLTLVGGIVSVGVGTVVYLSGRQTYSPVFNQVRHCLIAALLHILVGTAFVTAIAVFVFVTFDIHVPWPLTVVGASLFLLGSVYALAVAAWHYQRVLSVDYGDDSFERAVRDFRQAVRRFDADSDDIQTEALANICDAIERLHDHCIEPKLSDEEEVRADIETLKRDFLGKRSDVQKVVIQGEYPDGLSMDKDLEPLAQTFYRLNRNLCIIS